MTREEIEHLRALCTAATPEPWTLRETCPGLPELGSNLVVYGTHCTGTNFFQPKTEEDAAFVVAARAALPKLLDEVESLHSRLSLLEDEANHEIGELREELELHRYLLALGQP